MPEKFKIYLDVWPLLHTPEGEKQILTKAYLRDFAKVNQNPNSILITTDLPEEITNVENSHKYSKGTNVINKKGTHFNHMSIDKVNNELKKRGVKSENIELIVRGEYMHICTATEAGIVARELHLKPEQIRFKFKNSLLMTSRPNVSIPKAAYDCFIKKYYKKSYSGPKITFEEFMAQPFRKYSTEIARRTDKAKQKTALVEYRGKRYV